MSSRHAKISRENAILTAEIGEPRITERQLAWGRELREMCEHDLLAFNVECFPNSSGLKPCGPMQIDSIAHDQQVIENGGRVCKALFRGGCKTTMTCNAALWATLYGKRRMAPVFSQNLTKSKAQIIARWRAELLTNEALYCMFPYLVWPFRALENKYQRCASQTFNGELTHIEWKAEKIVFPTIEGELGSGAVLLAMPLSSCRGATHTTPDGEILRPDFAILDDVQKDEDAANPRSVDKLEELIDHGVLMLGGHSKRMSVVMNCTVREENDLGERYLAKRGWRRVRYKMLESLADNEDEHWFGPYADLLTTFDPESEQDENRARLDALAYYQEHREAMDVGAVASWEWAYEWDDEPQTEISAIQHAYNIRIVLGESVFACECQNEPLKEAESVRILPIDDICEKWSITEAPFKIRT